MDYKKNRFEKKVISLVLCAVMLMQIFDTANVKAESETGHIFFIKNSKVDDYYAIVAVKGVYKNDFYLQYNYNFSDGNNDNASITVSSSAVDVVSISDKSVSYIRNFNGSGTGVLECNAIKTGVSDITITYNEEKSVFHIIVVSAESMITEAEQTSYDEITLKWNKFDGCDGYSIHCDSGEGYYSYQSIKIVTGSSVTTTSVKPEYGFSLNYRVYPIIRWNNKDFYYTPNYYNDVEWSDNDKYIKTKSVEAEMLQTKIVSLKDSADGINIQWEWPKGAIKLDFYEINNIDDSMTLLKSTEETSETDWDCYVKNGEQKRIVILTTYKSSLVLKSDVIHIYKSKKGSLKKKKINKKVKLPYVYEQYDFYSSVATELFYYKHSNVLYAAGIVGKKIYIYKINDNNGKLSKYKVIKPGNFKHWGGLYQGTDGKFYVAIGYDNPKENDNKTVIKIIKYSSKWIKEGVCNIKGGAKNVFSGIVTPFDAGNCRMTMKDNLLYIETCRLMYEIDGVNHQSNIAFSLNTDDMSYKVSNLVYVSHSFNQYTQFKDFDLYILNHGDAYPRALELCRIKGYGNDEKTHYGVEEKNIFKIKGAQGNNTTGVTVGGMETTLGDNIITCGTAMPHKYKIKKVSGFKKSYNKNLFITITNFNENKTSVKWLTKNNPKKKTVDVIEAGMVKLSENRIAVLATMIKRGKYILKYFVIDENGKVIYKKSFKNACYFGGSKPVLHNGKIIWISENGTSYYNYYYSIPAVY